jgi:hypothetical protein
MLTAVVIATVEGATTILTEIAVEKGSEMSKNPAQ